MAIEPFNDEYFEHYAFFDYSKESKYDSAYNRFMGNLNIYQVIFSLYKSLFNKVPEHYVDLGCGTGEEMAWYQAKNVGVIGCDISPYVLARKNQLVADYIHEMDSITLMSKYAHKADVIMDSTLQYLEDDDFNKLMKLIEEKSADQCVFGIVFDETERNHPYRKQFHPVEYWHSKIAEYGFKSARDYVNGIFISKQVEEATKEYIFVKGI